MKRFAIVLIALVTLSAASVLWGQVPDPYRLIFWDFQHESLAPKEVCWYIMNASNISISTGDIQLMDGNDGGNNKNGWAPDTLWTQDTELDPQRMPAKYIEFSFRPRNHYAVHLTEMHFRFGRNELGPRAFAAAISADDFETGQFFLSEEIQSEDPNSLDGFMFDFQGAYFRYRGPDIKLSIRIWAYGALPDQNDTIDPDDQTTWPYLMMNNFDLYGYCVPFPVLAVLLDRSGSMGNEQFGLGYWPGAVQRAQLFAAEVLQDLDAVTFISYAVEDFESDDYKDHAKADWPMKHSNVKYSRLWPRITNPDSLVRRENIISRLEDIRPPNLGRTSIGSALRVGMDEIFEVDDWLPGRAAMLLLSDGLDNWNPMARHVIPLPRPPRPPANLMPDSIDIYTITLGNVADFDLMRAIPRYQGEYGAWVHAPGLQQLEELYWYIYFTGCDQMQYLTSIYRTMAVGGRDVHEVIVDDKTQNVKFILATGEEYHGQETTNIGFTLVSPSGRVVDCLTAQDIAGTEYKESFASKRYEVFLPEKGVWKLVVSGNGIFEEKNYHVMAVGNTNLRLDIELDEEKNIVEQPLNIVARVFDGNNPVRGSQISAFVYPPAEDTRNAHYSDVEGTPFADYEPDQRITRRRERTRNPGEGIEVVLSETEPGVYRGSFNDTDTAGPHNVKFYAVSEDGEVQFNRYALKTYLVSPPEKLPIPHLVQPKDGEEGLKTKVNFVWNDIFTAENYRFQLATHQEIIIDIDNIAENSIDIDSLDYNTEYMWRVRAVRDEEEGYWSGVWYFTVGLPDYPIPHSLQASVENEGVLINWLSEVDEHDFFGPLYSFWIYRNDKYLAGANPTRTYYLDKDVVVGREYSYYVQSAWGESGEWVSPPSDTVNVIMTGVEEEEMPTVTGIISSYPNPFNPETTIKFGMTEPGYTTITVYNIVGQKVRTLVNDRYEAGIHSVVWNAKDDNQNPVTSGVYMIKLDTSEHTGYSKVLLLK